MVKRGFVCYALVFRCGRICSVKSAERNIIKDAITSLVQLCIDIKQTGQLMHICLLTPHCTKCYMIYNWSSLMHQFSRLFPLQNPHSMNAISSPVLFRLPRYFILI
jgi:hypothetical protein